MRRTIESLAPWREAIGSVCADKVPQREIEQIIAKVKKTHPTFRWKHNALRHAYGSYRTALTQNVPQVAHPARIFDARHPPPPGGMVQP